MSFIDKLRSGELADARTILKAEPGLAQFREPNGVSAVIIARALGHADFAREIADAHPGIDLWEAAALGDVRRTVELLDAGTAVDAPNVDGYTPLGLAVHYGHLEETRLLLERGANPNVIGGGEREMMPIHLALARGQREIAALLVERGAEPDEPNGDDWTPLHYAADAGDLESARTLVKAGARTGYANGDGKTALEIAEDKGFDAVAKILAESAG